MSTTLMGASVSHPHLLIFSLYLEMRACCHPSGPAAMFSFTVSFGDPEGRGSVASLGKLCFPLEENFWEA
jgi:hypothetical protein